MPRVIVTADEGEMIWNEVYRPATLRVSTFATPWSTASGGLSPTPSPPGTWLLPGRFASTRSADRVTRRPPSQPVPSPPDPASPAARCAPQRRQRTKMDDELLDTEITQFLRAYGGAAAIPVDHIARALDLDDGDATRRVEQRLTSLAREGRVRRSRVFANRWLAATGPLGPGQRLELLANRSVQRDSSRCCAAVRYAPPRGPKPARRAWVDVCGPQADAHTGRAKSALGPRSQRDA
jgi:hypothetical protein